jgi:general stress protein YciG
MSNSNDETTEGQGLDAYSDEVRSNLVERAMLESERELRDEPKIGSLVSEVEAERVSWVWKGRLPRGEVVVCDGDPDAGKSTLLLDVSARLTTGRPMPGEDRPCRDGPGGVVYVTVEDSISRTMRPRLEAAGAALSKVCVVQGVPSDDGGPDVVPVIPDDLPALRRAVEDVAARLLVIDPLMAHLPGDINSFRDQDIRAALGPLSTFAKEAGVAVVVVRHLNKKTGGPALYRGGGSIGVIGAARVGLLLGTDPENEERRVLAPVKNNLSRPAPSLAFHLMDGDGDYGAARVEWEGEVDLSAQELLQPPKKKDGKLEEAKDWICARLSDGPRHASEMYDEAEADGLKKITLKRARKEVADAKRKGGIGSGGRWMWHLKERYAQRGNDAKGIIADDRLSDEAPSNVSKGDHLRGNPPVSTSENGAKSASEGSVPKKIMPDDRLSDRLSDSTEKERMQHTKEITSANPPRGRDAFAAGDRVVTPDGKGEVREVLDGGRVVVRHDDDNFGEATRSFDTEQVKEVS